jgi:hypothetical protein
VKIVIEKEGLQSEPRPSSAHTACGINNNNNTPWRAEKSQALLSHTVTSSQALPPGELNTSSRFISVILSHDRSQIPAVEQSSISIKLSEKQEAFEIVCNQ